MKYLWLILISWGAFAESHYVIDGAPLHWEKTPEIVNLTGKSYVDAALIEAVNSWEEIDFNFDVGSLPDVEIVWVKDWRLSQSIAAVTSLQTRDSEIVHATVLLNGKSILWKLNGPAWSFSFKRWKWKCNLIEILKHELGHVIGLMDGDGCCWMEF